MNGKNYMEIDKFSFKYKYFCFVDSNEYISDRIFLRRKLNVHLGDEYANSQSKYVIVFCKVMKKEQEEFLKAMKELEQKMLILGYRDYVEFCGRLQVKETEKKKTRIKRVQFN